MKLPRVLVVAIVGVALLAAACGDDDDTNIKSGSGDTRTVEVDMVDIAFQPDRLAVAAGETVRFVFTNRGEVAHDAFIGDADAQADHEAEMREAGDGDAHAGGHGDDESDAVIVEPGDSEEITYTFDDTGSVEIGCHQPGHYDAGMKIALEVAQLTAR
jgi:uncharacterized cupredoxin-like copper-binding protein